MRYEDHGESELFLTPITPGKRRGIMTKDPVCCLAGDAAKRAAQSMGEYDVSVLPVVEQLENKKLTGLTRIAIWS